MVHTVVGSKLICTHNFTLLGKSYDNYTNKFLQTTPLPTTPMFCLFHIPFTLSSAIITGISACT